MSVVHDRISANWHTGSQVPINTLNGIFSGGLHRRMSYEFRKALMWHMEERGTKIADLVKNTGVSRDVVNKLISRTESTTSAENAMLIAAYYGKTVNQFVAQQEVSPDDSAINLIGLLSPEERRILTAQMLGMVAQRP